MISLVSYVYDKNNEKTYIEPFDESLSINCPCPRPKKVKKYINSSSITEYKKPEKVKKCNYKPSSKVYIQATEIHSESTIKPIDKIDCPLRNSTCSIKNYYPQCQSDNQGYLIS